VLRKGKDILLH